MKIASNVMMGLCAALAIGVLPVATAMADDSIAAVEDEAITQEVLGIPSDASDNGDDQSILAVTAKCTGKYTLTQVGNSGISCSVKILIPKGKPSSASKLIGPYQRGGDWPDKSCKELCETGRVKASGGTKFSIPAAIKQCATITCTKSTKG